MKRDIELIREILVAMEATDTTQGLMRLQLPGRDSGVVSYHVKLLQQANLIEATDMSCSAEFEWVPRSLTWAGHEFLDAARNETVWNKAMSTLKDKAATVPFEIVKAVVFKTCKDLIGLG